MTRPNCLIFGATLSLFLATSALAWDPNAPYFQLPNNALSRDEGRLQEVCDLITDLAKGNKVTLRLNYAARPVYVPAGPYTRTHRRTVVLEPSSLKVAGYNDSKEVLELVRRVVTDSRIYTGMNPGGQDSKDVVSRRQKLAKLAHKLIQQARAPIFTGVATDVILKGVKTDLFDGDILEKRVEPVESDPARAIARIGNRLTSNFSELVAPKIADRRQAIEKSAKPISEGNKAERMISEQRTVILSK